jgi:hypothetical protein
MERTGFIKVWRRMLDSEVMQDDWLCRLWMWCLLMAEWQDGRNGMPGRGQFVTGRTIASAQLNVSPSKFYRGIHRLSELGCINVESNSYRTTITICNYSIYQDVSEKSEQQVNSKRTASEQPTLLDEEGKKGRSEIPHKNNSDKESDIMRRIREDRERRENLK